MPTSALDCREPSLAVRLEEPVDIPATPSRPQHELSYERWELIEFCVRWARVFGVSKSVGEIFGFVFSSSKPVTFEDVVTSLGLSGGSASHGLRFLRQIGALKLTYVARDRRDFYVAETSASCLLAGLWGENSVHEVGENRQRLRDLHAKLNVKNDAGATDLLRRVELMMDWSNRASDALKAALDILK